MCLIIAKPAGASFPQNFKEICRKAAECNDDGMGFAVPEGIYKDHTVKPDDFYQTLIQMVDKDLPAVIHWRYSTSGQTTTANCHPFQLEDGTMFAHNGNVSYRYAPGNGKSDTAVLADSVKNVYELYYQCLQLCSPSNKFAMITPKELGNELLIVGERHGTWEDGLWYSNLLWKTGRQRYAYQGGDYYGACYNTSVTRYEGSLKEKLAALIQKHGLKTVVKCLDNYCKPMEVITHADASVE